MMDFIVNVENIIYYQVYNVAKMKQSLGCNQELINIKDLLSKLITDITSLKIKLPEDQKTLTEAQVFFNGGVESAIQKIRKASRSLEMEHEKI
jgi:hypothetical protein